MKKIISVILIISLSGCMSASPRAPECTISMEKFDWDYKNTLVFDNESFDIKLTISRSSGNIFNLIADWYAVDKESSTRRYLSDHYEVCLLEIRNKTCAQKYFYLSKLNLVNKNKAIIPISPVDLPSDIKRISPKEISKVLFVTALVIALIAAIVACCILAGNVPVAGINPFPSAGDRKKEGDKAASQEEKYSSFFHNAKIKYEDLILNKNAIAAHSGKSGIVFISKAKYKVNDCNLIYK